MEDLAAMQRVCRPLGEDVALKCGYVAVGEVMHAMRGRWLLCSSNGGKAAVTCAI